MYEYENLQSSFRTLIESAYIIRIPGHAKSMEYAQRCADSCEVAGMPYKFFDAVNGTTGKVELPDKDIVKLLKVTNTGMTPTEVACFISHFLLWVHCVEIDQPIVILEHDAIMLKPYLEHDVYSMIRFLGSMEQVSGQFNCYFPLPPHASLNSQYRFICRAHAYAVDPPICRQLIAKVIKYGIMTPLDIFMRADEFPIIQLGIFAYDHPLDSVIDEVGKREGKSYAATILEMT